VRRKFNQAEDEAILAQSRGELGVKSLLKIVRSSLRTVEKRAYELGVELKVERRSARVRIFERRYHNMRDEDTKEVGLPYVLTVGEDPLLAALIRHHGGGKHDTR